MMRRREILAGSFAPLACLLASGCAKRKHLSNRSPAPSPRPASGKSAAAKQPQSEAAEPPPTSEIGLASWYGYPYHGRMAADGEIYDMEKLTAAHRTLPFNTWVRVTNLVNGKGVTVRITDRGPFVDGRVIDLSHAAAREIEMIGPGVVRVRVNVILFPAALPPSLYSIQVGAFADHSRAERLCSALQNEYGAARLVFRDGAPPSWRLLVGIESSTEAAQQLARKLEAEVGSAFVVRLDERAVGFNRAAIILRIPRAKLKRNFLMANALQH